MSVNVYPDDKSPTVLRGFTLDEVTIVGAELTLFELVEELPIPADALFELGIAYSSVVSSTRRTLAVPWSSFQKQIRVSFVMLVTSL